MKLELANHQVHTMIDGLDALCVSTALSIDRNDTSGKNLRAIIEVLNDILGTLGAIDTDYYWDATLKEKIEKLSVKAFGTIEIFQSVLDLILAQSTPMNYGPDGDETIEWDS